MRLFILKFVSNSIDVYAFMCALSPVTLLKRERRVSSRLRISHDDVIKWKHFPRYWPFVRGIHRSPVNSPHKSQWRGALMFSLIFVWTNGWVNNRGAGDLRRHRAHNDVTVIRRSKSDVLWEKSHARKIGKWQVSYITNGFLINILITHRKRHAVVHTFGNPYIDELMMCMIQLLCVSMKKTTTAW